MSGQMITGAARSIIMRVLPVLLFWLVGAEQSDRRMNFHSLKVLAKEVNTHSVRQGNKKNGRCQEKCQYMYRKD